MNNNHSAKDIFGKAISTFYNKKDETEIIVHSPDFEDDVIPVSYLFRKFAEMPLLEQTALKLTSGKVLDVGCGAGSHALFLQNEKKLKVTAIDTSAGAIEICKKRGLKDVRNQDFFELQGEKFDTILMLMNGSGIIGKLDRLDHFFEHVRTLLARGGKVLIDSSDLSYLFDRDEDGGIWIDPEESYYGELQFQVSYKDEKSDVFDWLYVDFNLLKLAARRNKFECILVKKGEHYDYLVQLQPESL